MTTEKTIALTIWTLSAKWSLLFNMLFRFVIAFLPRSKHLLTSWLQSSSTVILDPKKIAMLVTCLLNDKLLLFSRQVVSNSLWPHGPARQAFLSFTISQFAQTHVHWVSDAIQPSHPLSPPFPPALKLSQHQDLFQWVCSLYQVVKVLELQFQHQSFQWILRDDFL